MFIRGPSVYSGSRRLFGVRRLFELILGSVMLVFLTFKVMKKLVTVIVYVFVYVQFHLSTRIYYVL